MWDLQVTSWWWWKGNFCGSRTLPRLVNLTCANRAMYCLAGNQSLCTKPVSVHSSFMFQSMCAVKACWPIRWRQPGQDRATKHGCLGECFCFWDAINWGAADWPKRPVHACVLQGDLSNRPLFINIPRTHARPSPASLFTEAAALSVFIVQNGSCPGKTVMRPCQKGYCFFFFLFFHIISHYHIFHYFTLPNITVCLALPKAGV